MFNIGDKVYIISHSVYGDPNGKLNEPYIIPSVVEKIFKDTYLCRYIGYPGLGEIPKKLVFKTKIEAEEYISKNRDNIIKESFEQHQKFFKNELKKARERRILKDN